MICKVFIQGLAPPATDLRTSPALLRISSQLTVAPNRASPVRAVCESHAIRRSGDRASARRLGAAARMPALLAVDCRGAASRSSLGDRGSVEASPRARAAARRAPVGPAVASLGESGPRTELRADSAVEERPAAQAAQRTDRGRQSRRDRVELRPPPIWAWASRGWQSPSRSGRPFVAGPVPRALRAAPVPGAVVLRDEPLVFWPLAALQQPIGPWNRPPRRNRS